MNSSILNMKFSEGVDNWLKFKKPQIKESTYLNYKQKINSKLKNELGEMTIGELLNFDFNNFVERLLSTLSEKTVKDIIVVLKQILGFFEKKYDVNFKLDLITSPKTRQKDVEIFEDRDRKKLEKYCLELEKIRGIGILISLYSGLRIGEVCALKWKNIDMDKKLIIIDHTLQRVYVDKNNSKIIYTTPKTAKSIRIVPVAQILLDKLKELYKENHYSEEAFVLTGMEERPIEPISYRYTYKKILKKNGIKFKRYHVLRHTFATRCVKIGMDTKSLSEILGHSNVSITLNLYVHPSLETKNRYINKLCI